jgi:hypothetical protein
LHLDSYIRRRLCPTLARKKTHVSWDEPKELSPLKSLTPKFKLEEKVKIFSYLPTLPTYLHT